MIFGPIDYSRTDQALRQLSSRTDALLQQLNSQSGKEATFLFDAALRSDVLPGHLVYWNEAEKHFEPAIAEAQVLDSLASQTERALAVGMCTTKGPGNTGQIGVGLLRLSSTAWNNLGQPSAGLYYLSPADPGGITASKPTLAIPAVTILGVLNSCDGDAFAFVLPTHRDLLEDHVHYSIDLHAVVAGAESSPVIDVPHVIDLPDSNFVGWLPADDAIFDGRAPAGAKFGYNLVRHAELNNIWPPIPIEAATIELIASTADSLLPNWSRLPKEVVQIDRYGIWWMIDCYGQVPWPLTAGPSVESCPVEVAMRLTLSFAKMTFATDKSVVTSLRPAAGSPIILLNEYGEAASTGDLHIAVDPTASSQNTDAIGSLVLKQIEGLVFRQGRVIEGLTEGSGVTLSSSHGRLLDPEAVAGPGNPYVHQGVVQIDVTPSDGSLELSPQVIHLGAARAGTYKGLQYLGFPAGRDSTLNFRFDIPKGVLQAPGTFKLRIWLFGKTAGPYSNLTATYKLVGYSDDPVPIPSTASALAIDIVTPSDDVDGLGTNVAADSIIVVESGTIDIDDEGTLFIEISRTSDALPEYESEICLLRTKGILAS